MFKVVYINAKEQKIEERMVNGLADLQALVEGYIEPVMYFDDNRRTALFADEEGLLKNHPYGFTFTGYPSHVVGNGFISTCDEEGESIHCPVTPENIKDHVRFLDLTGVVHEVPMPVVIFSSPIR